MDRATGPWVGGPTLRRELASRDVAVSATWRTLSRSDYIRRLSLL